MAFWNSTDTSQPGPPINTGKVTIPQQDIRNLKEVFVNATAILKNLEPLHLEAAVLSRSIYLNKNAYRSEKGFQKLDKINRALLQYHSMNLESIYNKFSNTLPLINKHTTKLGRVGSGEYYMPTRQMLEWILVRTQGFARLFSCIAQSCLETSSFWMVRVRMGHTYNYSIAMLGILSRIWAYAKYLVVSACAWYAELLPYLKVLKPVGMTWLPKDYRFPEDLKVWLNVPHITIMPNEDNAQAHKAISELKKVFDTFGLNVDSECRRDTKNAWDEYSVERQFEFDSGIDVGEVISREAVMERPRNNQGTSYEFKEEKGKKQKKPKRTLIDACSSSTSVNIVNATSSIENLVHIKKKKKIKKIEENDTTTQFKINNSTDGFGGHLNEQFKKKKRKKRSQNEEQEQLNVFVDEPPRSIGFDLAMNTSVEELENKTRKKFKKKKKLSDEPETTFPSKTSTEKLDKLMRKQQKKKRMLSGNSSLEQVQKHVKKKRKMKHATLQ